MTTGEVVERETKPESTNMPSNNWLEKPHHQLKLRQGGEQSIGRARGRTSVYPLGALYDPNSAFGFEFLLQLDELSA
ncbi:hypothetical protein N7447_009227 [Penicillium robsamsonii]|uniref:uncharacterized protein n=1 Tax=Penicillium robsamsonii TaxID=1792511 RepID=UPI002546FA93|nr:uncharacterized protein N7447_009227 [Penicillium robsamsonii]KAJ5816994.1 hypothetical protein N7447_009227 [Penicillium robsamsonii]